MSTRRVDLSSIKLSEAPDAHAELWLDRYMDDQDSKKRGDFIAKASTISTPGIYVTFYNRWIQTLDALGAKKRPAHVKTRMIVGLGDESVLETSITLHKTYGIPYIPGSALKGLAASYARQRLGEDWQKDSKTNDAYKVVFGNTDEAGYITFFDALYIPKPNIKEQALYPDVMTVHHRNYYQNPAIPPADWDDPNPVPFLTATGDYMIALAAPELDEQDAWIEKTFAILGYALAEMGIGAKTSSGYGRLEFR
jgi:CRISPR-associated protein Cmr6